MIIIIYIDESGFGVKFNLSNKEGFSDIINIYFCTSLEKDKSVKLLSNEEKNFFDTLKYPKRINSFLLGRTSAKKAVANLVNYYNYKYIEINNGIFNQPYIACEKINNVNITLSHCDKLGVAVAFSEKNCVGIDVEIINENSIKSIKSQCTENEIQLLNNIFKNNNLGLTSIWCSKEALSKIIKTGLTLSFEILELANIKFIDNYIISDYKNFHQYKSISWQLQDEIFSLVLPTNLINDNFLSDFQKFLEEYRNQINLNY